MSVCKGMVVSSSRAESPKEIASLSSTAVRRLALWAERYQKAYALFTFITRSARLNKQRSGDFRLFPRQILRTPRFCLRRKSLRSLCKISSPKRLQLVMPPTPQGRMNAREQGVPRLKVSAFLPRHNIIGPKLCNNPRASCGLITQFRLC